MSNGKREHIASLKMVPFPNRIDFCKNKKKEGRKKCMCVCVCVCVRERERKREIDSLWLMKTQPYNFTNGHTMWGTKTFYLLHK